MRNRVTVAHRKQLAGSGWLPAILQNKQTP